MDFFRADPTCPALPEGCGGLTTTPPLHCLIPMESVSTGLKEFVADQ